MSQQDKKHRSHLPMPNTAPARFIPYDAKDPDMVKTPIEQLRPPKGAPNVLIVLIDDCRLRRVQRLRRPLPHAGGGEAGGGRPQVQPLPHHGDLLGDAAGPADRPQPSLRRHGRHHRDRHRRSRATPRCCPTRCRRWRRRSSSTATTPPSSASATKCRCGSRARSGRSTSGPRAAAASSTSTASSAARRTSGTPRSTKAPPRSRRPRAPEEGYHLLEDMTDKAIGWISQQKALAPDKPFFVYFAPGATHAPAPRAQGVGRQVQGQVRRRLGQAARGDLRPAEEAGRHPGGLPAHPAPQGRPGLGRHAGGVQAGAAPGDGGLRGLPGVHRPPRGTALRRHREARHLRRHARLLHHRRQRRLRRGLDQRLLQRDELLQRPASARDGRVPHGAARQARRARFVQPLRRGLGARA